MADEVWREFTFEELIKREVLEIGDGYRAKNSELGGDGPIFLRAGHVRDAYIDFDGVDRFRRELGQVVAPKMSRAGDVAVTTKGNSTGRVAYISDDLPPFVYSPHLSYWRSLNTSVIYPGFLRYWSRSYQFKSQLSGLAASTDMAPYLSLIDQRRLRILLPTPLEQRAIGHILGSLDDKIELNRRINETLEGIARALFKSWFVDFDPVRAKAEGRDPALAGPVAALFPDSFETLEPRVVPKGWHLQEIGKLLTLDKGLSYKGACLADLGTPMVNLGCFLGKGKFSEQAIKHYTGEFRPQHVVRQGDLVIANTDITQKREVIGSPALIPPHLGTDKVIFTHHVFAARFLDGKQGWRLFTYFALLQEAFRERAAGFATGTTVLALPRDAVLNLPIITPPIELVQIFGSMVEPLVARIWHNAANSRILAGLRDTLLPKLVSGDLRIPDAKQVLGGSKQ
jgi:type I restriction enzyme S subunit